MTGDLHEVASGYRKATVLTLIVMYGAEIQN